MPEQSTGGPLVERPQPPHVERPASLVPGAPVSVPGTVDPVPAVDPIVTVDPVVTTVDPIAAAVETWRRALAGSGMPDTLLAAGPQATASWLDLTHAHPSGLAQLFAARPTRLSSLFREADAHAGAWRQARTIRASALVLSAQRGVQGCCLAVGVASWRPRGGEVLQAPIVLRGCSIRPRGAGDDDFDLDLEDAVLINPELVRELVETYGIEADGAHLAALAQGPKGFDPRPVYAWLEQRCPSLRAFRIERSLVLATFAAGSGAVLADLDAAVPAIASHGLLRRVASAAGRPSIQDVAAPTGKVPPLSAIPTARTAPDPLPAQPTPSTPDAPPVVARPPVSPPPPAASVPPAPAPPAHGRAHGRAQRGLTTLETQHPSAHPQATSPSTTSGPPAAPALADAALPTVPTRPSPADDAPTVLQLPIGSADDAPTVLQLPTAPEAKTGGRREHRRSNDVTPAPLALPSTLAVHDPPRAVAPDGADGDTGAEVGLEPGGEVVDSRRVAAVGRLTPRGTRAARPPEEPDPAAELLVLDCDPAQQEALAAALRGENVVIEGPPGSGATHTVAAAIAGLVADGKRVLVLSPRRASTEALLSRLEAAGIGDLVLDLRDSIGGRPATRTIANTVALRSGLDAATSATPPISATAATSAVAGAPLATPAAGAARGVGAEVLQNVRRARELLDGSVEALHEVRKPWGISVYDAMEALAELTGRPGSPTSRVRLDDDVLARTDTPTREKLRVHLQSAAAAGAFTLTRLDTRWYDAQVGTDDQARRALEAAIALRSGLDRARTAMDAVTAAAGLRPAAEVKGWTPLLDLMLGVRAVVDSMSPSLYQQPLEQLAEAIAPRHLRSTSAAGPGRAERRRLRKQAHALVRPGVHVPDLHALLLTAIRQRETWRRISVSGEPPHVITGLTEAEALVRRVAVALAVLSQVFGATVGPELAHLPLADLERRVFDLAGDTEGILGQPRRATLRDGLARAGFGALVEDLHERRVPAEKIDAEFDLVWWSSVREHIVRSDPRLARHDPKVLRQAADDLRRAETARITAGAGVVRAAVLSRASRAAASRAGQVRILREELAREDRRPRMADLARRCPDVLGALTPVWMMSPDTVAACLAPAEPGKPAVIDTVVVDDAGHIGLPEVVASLARGAQVIVAGDRRRLAPPDGSTSVIEAVAPFARVCRLDRDHRARDGRMLVPLAPRYPEGWQLTPGIAVLPPLSLEAVPDGMALPPPGEELPVSADAEVQRVVDLVELHAVRHPDESLAVITLAERHAERIEEALRAQVADRPILATWLTEQWRDGRPEPFVLHSVQRVLGVERDAAIVAIGLARTPHGRVLHRFGALDGDNGAAALTTAVSRARNRTAVVCCFGADDLVVDRLRTTGARLLRDVLLAAGGRGTAGTGRTSATTDGLISDLRDRLAATGLPVRVRLGDGAWPLDIAVADPRVAGRMLVAVDVDGPSFASRSCRERERNRPMRWQRAGWVHLKISSMDLFSDPALEVDRIRAAWERALSVPLAGDADPMPDGDHAPFPPPPPAPPERTTGGSWPEPAWVGSPDVSTPPPGPSEDDDAPVIPVLARDDSDEGWGERDLDDRDEQMLRDRPPHWA